MKPTKPYKGRIVVHASVHFGKPCIANTRIPVEAVLELIEENVPFDKIIADYYPELQVDDIKACIRYVTDLIRSEEIRIGSRQEKTGRRRKSSATEKVSVDIRKLRAKAGKWNDGVAEIRKWRDST